MKEETRRSNITKRDKDQAAKEDKKGEKESPGIIIGSLQRKKIETETSLPCFLFLHSGFVASLSSNWPLKNLTFPPSCSSFVT